MQSEGAAILHERLDHRHDELPPKFAESGVEPPGFSIESPGQHRQVLAEMGSSPRDTESGDKNQTARGRKTIAHSLREAMSIARLRARGAGRAPKSGDSDANDVQPAPSERVLARPDPKRN